MKMRAVLLMLGVCCAGHAADEIPIPVELDAEGFYRVLVRVGDELFIAGQPTPEGLERLQALGVTTVINLRTQGEMDDRERVPFDEAELLEKMGVRYVHIPSGGEDSPYSPEMVGQFAAALESAEGKVLLHCTVAWRVSHLYAAYLYRYRDLPLDVAIEHGEAINFGTLPLEGFLAQPLLIQVSE